jgi:hypothetical protein
MARTFDRFAGASAIVSAALTLLYSIAFVIVSRTSAELGPALAALFLTAGGVIGSAVVVGLYGRLRDVQPGFALWALLLGFTASAGSFVHGGFQLANAIHPPQTVVGADLPSEIDPRGLLAFGIAGLATLVFAWLILSAGGQRFSLRVGYTGVVFGVLLVLTYLGRLVVLDPSSPLVLLPAALSGFVVGPLWYLWVGLEMSRHSWEVPGNTA